LTTLLKKVLCVMSGFLGNWSEGSLPLLSFWAVTILVNGVYIC
jgi:hypothetical protein